MNKNRIFKQTDLSYYVDYDYKRTGCTCHESICRCTQIYDANVNMVKVTEVITNLFAKYKCSNSWFDAYCFDRICYAMKIYDVNLYEVEVGWGYYGQEVYGVWFENEEKIFNAYHEVLELNTNLEKIQYCLNLEYGYLLDCVKDATSASIITVSVDDIRLPQMEYFQKVDAKIIDAYKDRLLPIGVCMKDGNRYKLIDGYHRFVANKDNDEVEIVVIE